MELEMKVKEDWTKNPEALPPTIEGLFPSLGAFPP
jgi:hypothetical protein